MKTTVAEFALLLRRWSDSGVNAQASLLVVQEGRPQLSICVPGYLEFDEHRGVFFINGENGALFTYRLDDSDYSYETQEELSMDDLAVMLKDPDTVDEIGVIRSSKFGTIVIHTFKAE